LLALGLTELLLSLLTSDKKAFLVHKVPKNIKKFKFLHSHIGHDQPSFLGGVQTEQVTFEVSLVFKVFFGKPALLPENSFPKVEQRAGWDQSSGVMSPSHTGSPALFCSPLKAPGNTDPPNEAVEDASSNTSLMPRMFLW